MSRRRKPLLFGTEELYASLPPKYRRYMTGTAPMPASLKKVLAERERRGWVNVVVGNALNPEPTFMPELEKLAGYGKRYREQRKQAVKTRHEAKLDCYLVIRSHAEKCIHASRRDDGKLTKKAFVNNILAERRQEKELPGRSKLYHALEGLVFPGDST